MVKGIHLMKKQIEEKFIEEIIDVIQKIASGDFSIKISLSEEQCPLDPIASGINMLSEEIEAHQQQLKNKIEELEKYKKITVNRELKMTELKKEIDSLLKKYGEGPKYYRS